MKIELWPLDKVVPYDNNPRLNDGAVDAVAKSIGEFGFRQPIVVDEDHVIIVGHTRYKAAQKLSLDRVPVHVAKGLSADQVKAYRLADNKTGELAEWNLDLLPIELADLRDAEFDVSLLGFSSDELSSLFDPGVQDGLCDPDDVPEPPDDPVTRPGDLWVLGDHRLLCGDSAKPGDVDRLLDGQPVHLVNTDPPYNVRVAPRSNNAHKAGSRGLRAQNCSGKTTGKLRAKDRPLANDFISDEEFDKLVDAWFGNIARVLLPGHAFYIWGGGYPGSGGAKGNHETYPQFMRAHGLKYAQLIIWDKEHPVLTRKDFMGAHESCFYGWREDAAHRYFGPNNVSDLWRLKKVNPNKMVHLTEKPVELAVRAIQYSTRTGENVLDLFGGSGSTVIAAEQTDRQAFLIELDPMYCDVIVERWETFTGRKAERQSAAASAASQEAVEAR
ncbi:chromosome partitioning protein ParB [Roseiconus nitratireducens]|uniref:Methyltransferase n=1 Tax=Roseiconus nitratireducens TaxID=2605748 RepID=A0A5M6D566_9BACT|nr:DNA modification methylase [Roseiconus nitratireducens]KAA5541896.1 chromosome partitioning protein ParB [Roseiconus nitratireducens]